MGVSAIYMHINLCFLNSFHVCLVSQNYNLSKGWICSILCVFFLLSPSSSCVSTGSIWPVRFCYALCVLAKGLFHLWQVRLLSWQTNPPQNPPLHVRMSKALSRHSLCVWIDRSVCHVGMLRAVCLVGQWKLVTPYCGSRAYPWKEPGCPPLSFLFSNSLTLILLSSSVLSSAWTCAVTLAQMWGGESPAL